MESNTSAIMIEEDTVTVESSSVVEVETGKDISTQSSCEAIVGIPYSEYMALKKAAQDALSVSTALNDTTKSYIDTIKNSLDQNLSSRAYELIQLSEAMGTSISTLQESFETENLAVSQTITTHIANLNGNIAAVQEQIQTLASEDEALSLKTSTLVSKVDGAVESLSVAHEQLSTYASELDARAESITQLGARIGDSEAKYDEVLGTYTDADGNVKAQKIESLEASTSNASTAIGEINQAIISESDTRVEQLQYFQNQLDDSEAKYNLQLSLYVDDAGNVKSTRLEALAASLDDHGSEIANAVIDINDLSKQIDGVVETHFGTAAVVNDLGQILLTAEPYATWNSENRKAIHTGDSYVLYEVEADGSKNYLGAWKFGKLVTPNPPETDSEGYGFYRIVDKETVDALTKATEAIETANHKIVTYYLNRFPTITDTPIVNGQHIGFSNGDFLIRSDQENNVYRYQDGSWIDIRDTHLDASVEEHEQAIAAHAEAIDTINETTLPALQGTLNNFKDGVDENGDDFAWASNSKVAVVEYNGVKTVTGFEMISGVHAGATVSAMAFQADHFQFVYGSTLVQPLVMDAQGGITLNGRVSFSNVTGSPTIPSKVSDLSNDSGYVPSTTIIDGNYIKTELLDTARIRAKFIGTNKLTADNVDIGFANISGTLSFNSLGDKPTIPSKVSDLSNDSGYVPSSTIISGAYIKTPLIDVDNLNVKKLNQLGDSFYITSDGMIVGANYLLKNSYNKICNKTITILSSGVTSTFTDSYFDTNHKMTYSIPVLSPSASGSSRDRIAEALTNIDFSKLALIKLATSITTGEAYDSTKRLRVRVNVFSESSNILSSYLYVDNNTLGVNIDGFIYENSSILYELKKKLEGSLSNRYYLDISSLDAHFRIPDIIFSSLSIEIAVSFNSAYWFDFDWSAVSTIRTEVNN